MGSSKFRLNRETYDVFLFCYILFLYYTVNDAFLHIMKAEFGTFSTFISLFCVTVLSRRTWSREAAYRAGNAGKTHS